MTTSLLDLDDVILQRIAFFINRDNHTPFTSFRPHWAAFVHEISSRNLKDFFNWRSTCRRVYDNAILKNLQIEIYDGDSMCRWINECPDKVLRAVRPHAETHYGIFPNSRLNIPISFTELDIFAWWNILINLLSLLTSLEELAICSHFQCLHRNKDWIKTLRLPPRPILPQLRSLSIGLECQPCSFLLTKSIVIMSPRIQHLRCSLHPDQPSQSFQELSNLWCDHNKQSYLPLQTLLLSHKTPEPTWRVPFPEPPIDEVSSIIPVVIQLCSKIQRLHVSTFEAISNYMVSGMSILFDDQIEGDMKIVLQPSLSTDMPLAEYLASFPSTPDLKHVDWGIVVRPRNPTNIHRPIFRFPGAGQPHIYRRLLEYMERADTQLYVGYYHNMLTCVADQLLEYFPSLEGGFFWEAETHTDPRGWYRWSWSAQQGDNGIKRAVVDKHPNYLLKEFIRKRYVRGIDPCSADCDHPKYFAFDWDISQYAHKQIW